MAAVVRCDHSMMACGLSNGGTQLPWQVGHSGQPSPDPVERTTTPTTTSRKVIATVTAASLVNRVNASRLESLRGRQGQPMIAAVPQRPARRLRVAGSPKSARARKPTTRPARKPPTCAIYATPPPADWEDAAAEPIPLTHCRTAHSPLVTL